MLGQKLEAERLMGSRGYGDSEVQKAVVAWSNAVILGKCIAEVENRPKAMPAGVRKLL